MVLLVRVPLDGAAVATAGRQRLRLDHLCGGWVGVEHCAPLEPLFVSEPAAAEVGPGQRAIAVL
ncbi:MAG: hypothetical protein Q8Q14_11480, partial [Gemmatimonadales bacterium]|nr:hypothetical protein [Gemmatimonadales bacterium]